MQQMTRPEFEAYRQRVEAALARFERILGESERAGFEEIAAAAREVIGIRREYLDASERGAPVEVMRGAGKGDGNTGEPEQEQEERPDEAVAREALGRISDAEEFLSLATRAWRDPAPYRREVDEAYAVAGRLAASGNSILREEAAKMPSLRDAMLSFEASSILDELRMARELVAQSRRQGIASDTYEERRDAALEKATMLALEGNDHLRNHAERDAELVEWIRWGERNQAEEALEAVDQRRQEMQATTNRPAPDRANDMVEGARAVPDIDTRAQQRLLDEALTKAGELGLRGNPFMVEVAARDPELKMTIEHMRAGSASDIAVGIPAGGLSVSPSDPAIKHLPEPDGARTILGEIANARRGLEEFMAGGMTGEEATLHRDRLSDNLWRAARLAVESGDPVVREAARHDRALAQVILDFDKHRATYNAGCKAHSLPENAKGDAVLLDVYRAGLETFEANLVRLQSRGEASSRMRTEQIEDWAKVNELWRALEFEERMIELSGAPGDSVFEDKRVEPDPSTAAAISGGGRANQVGSPIARHGGHAVRAGETLLAQIDDAATSAASLREPEVRYDHGTGRYSSDEPEAEHSARMAKLKEAENTHSQLLEHAARQALDENPYLREVGESRIDLGFAINMETWRRTNPETRRHDDVETGARASTPHEGEGRSLGGRGTDPSPQQMSRLQQIERDFQEERGREHDDREGQL